MARFHNDGNGVTRHLAGMKRSPGVPDSHRRQLVRGAMPVDLPRQLSVDSFSQVPVRDQDRWGRCVGEMWRALFDFLEVKSGRGSVNFSSWFPYNMGRDFEGTPLTEDSGLMITESAKSVEKTGMCLDRFMPSDEDHFAEEPDDAAKASGLEHQAVLSYHCPTLHEIRASLQQDYVVGVGMSVFQNMMSNFAAKTGSVFYPEPGEKLLGGHAIVIHKCDMDEVLGSKTGTLTCRTSWGEDWGTHGDFKLPVDYINDGLADEALTLRVAEL